MSQKSKLTHFCATLLGADANVKGMMNHADRALVKSALEKMNAGKSPNAREGAAIKRAESSNEEARRWAFYRSVPKKHYREMSGRAARVLIDQADTWKIPCKGPTVDVTAVVKWIHDFIAGNSHRLIEDDQDSDDSKALERMRNASAEKLEMEVAQTRGELLPRGLVEEVSVVLVDRLVRCMSSLETKVSTEFALWLADPKVQAMPADKRARLVREFVSNTCRQIRDLEAKDMLALIDEKRTGESKAAVKEAS